MDNSGKVIQYEIEIPQKEKKQQQHADKYVTLKYVQDIYQTDHRVWHKGSFHTIHRIDIIRNRFYDGTGYKLKIHNEQLENSQMFEN